MVFLNHDWLIVLRVFWTFKTVNQLTRLLTLNTLSLMEEINSSGLKHGDAMFFHELPVGLKLCTKKSWNRGKPLKAAILLKIGDRKVRVCDVPDSVPFEIDHNRGIIFLDN